MKLLRILVFVPLLFTFTSCEDFLNTIEDPQLSNSEVIAGLKEALNIGTDNSVGLASAVDGFLQNDLIKIPIPPEAEVVADVLVNALGNVGQAAVDEFIVKLNRTAEDASSKATPIFKDAITGITIQDGFDILFGADNEATMYLQDNTFNELIGAFKPDVETSLNTVGLDNAWEDVATLYNNIPFVDPVNVDLAQYTTEMATEGLFKLIEKEELKIREDPIARVTDLLEKVFGELDE